MSPARSARASRAGWILAWLLVAAVVASVVLAGLTRPLAYDEAYNLQVPRHLVEDGRYATDGSVYPGADDREFDVFISTGPTLLVPVAAAMAVLGDHTWVVRLVPSVCFLAVLALAGLTGRRAAGGAGALVAVLGVLGLSLRSDGGMGMQGSGDVLGEVLAAALLLAGAFVVGRHPVRAALLLGLAVLTKLLVLLVLPAFLLVALRAVPSTWKSRLRRAGAVVLCAVAPLLGWQLVQLLVLGPATWRSRSQEFVLFFATAGSGIVPDPLWDTGRVSKFAEAWSAPPLAGLVLAVVVGTSGWWWSRGRAGVSVPSDVAATAWCAGGAGGLLLLWWATVAGRAMGRYLVPPLLLLVVAVLPLAVLVLQHVAAEHRRANPGRTTGSGLTVVVAVAALVGALAGQAVLHAVEAWDRTAASTPAEQQVVADVVAEAVAESGRPLVGVGWWQTPEIGYLASTRSQELGSRGGVLVLSAVQADLSPADYRQGLDRCARTRLRLGGYVVCDVEPEAARDDTASAVAAVQESVHGRAAGPARRTLGR